jgi:hypothetical protein
MTRKQVNEAVNNQGVALIVEVIHDKTTRCAHSVTQVINTIEAIMFKFRLEQRTQLVGFQAIKALWFGWRAVNWPSSNPAEYGAVPDGVRRQFVLKCIEVGTEIGVNQIPANQRRSK